MAEPLKNMYNHAFFADLIVALRSAYPAFDAAQFLACIYDDDWESRELKQRMRHISQTLARLLPSDYRAALDILLRAAPALNGYTFETMIFPDFVEIYGLSDWDASLPALEQFTQQSSAEYAVRPFILQDQGRMMAQMEQWANHQSHHVRRLASEGCRPRLPWAVALPAFKADPSPILPILEQLKLDESDYVRRSVANNLNDISKDHPQVVLDTLKQWQTHDSPHMRWMISHALRTLLKQGNAQALELLGYSGATTFTVSNLTLEPLTVVMGGDVTITFTIQSLSDAVQNLMVDYVMHFQGANGQLRPKVFKLKKIALAPGETLTITRKHTFKPITTRSYYPGQHAVEIQINGILSERKHFTLT